MGFPPFSISMRPWTEITTEGRPHTYAPKGEDKLALQVSLRKGVGLRYGDGMALAGHATRFLEGSELAKGPVERKSFGVQDLVIWGSASSRNLKKPKFGQLWFLSNRKDLVVATFFAFRDPSKVELSDVAAIVGSIRF